MKAKPMRQSYRCKVSTVIPFDDVIFVRVEVPYELELELVAPGSFVFARINENPFFDTPISVLFTEFSTGTIGFAVITKGVKTISDQAAAAGQLLADTKFEWGTDAEGKIILIDEVLTPDSSRFWPADKYEAGRDQESFDKQFVRNYLESINFDKSGSGVELPADIVENTSKKYIEAYEKLTGKEFAFK